MADAVPVTPPTPTSPRGRQNSRARRSRGGFGSNQAYNADGSRGGHGFRGARSGQSQRGRGRGDSSQSDFIPDTQLTINDARAPGHSLARGSLEGRLNAETLVSGGNIDRTGVEDQDKPAEEGEVCFICASTIEHLSIAPCNHQTCHICALRLRALYKKRDCAYCKVCSTVLLTAVKATDESRLKHLM